MFYVYNVASSCWQKPIWYWLEYISLEAFAKVPNEKIIIYTDLKIQEQ